MSKVEELLEKYNPDGVEDLTLGEICLNHDSKRRPISKGNRIPGNIPYYGANGIQDYVDDYLFNGEYILVGEDGSVITEEGTPIVKWVYGKFWVNNHAHIFSENLNKALLKYVFYILQINKIKDLVRGVPPKLTKESVLSISLKIPHIKVQEEIVNILDSFTNLIDALNEELSLRQKQFEYYREKLLTFDDNTNRYCLKEVFETKNGYTPSTSNKEYWDKGNIPWFRMEDIRQNGRILNDSTLHITRAGVKGNRLFKANSIILATSATIGEHALILVEHLSNQRFTNFYPNEDFDKKINMKYIYYYMFIIDEWCKSHVNQGGFASVDMDGLFKLSIPIPSLAIQQSIVEKLDAFESLISSLKEEISLRQKQYEYYREKLLTFN